jgi:protein ImuA
VAGATYADRPAAFGFVVALMTIAASVPSGSDPSPHRSELHTNAEARGLTPTRPAFLVATRRALAHFGRPYGRGLGQAGLDPGRLILVETRCDKDALWALEEVLTSDARPAVVAGAVEAPLGLTESRRLNLAAARCGTPLLVLRAPDRTGSHTGTSAAATRWRIAAAPAGRDRFRALVGPRWRIALERCRHGRPGEWLIEWDHAAYSFRLAQVVADRASAAGARPQHANWHTGWRRAG